MIASASLRSSKTRFLSSCVAALSVVLLAFNPDASAQSSSPMLKTGITVDVCSSCDLLTQEKVASEDGRHDVADAALDGSERSENVSHDEADQSINRSTMQGEMKQEALANEQERHENALTALERQRAIEAARHQKYLAQIMASAGKLLSDLVQNAASGGSAPGGGAPAGGGAPSNPSGGGNPSMPSGAPNGGGNPVAGGSGPPAGGSNPSGAGPAQNGGNNPVAGGTTNNPGGSNPASGGGGTEYPGAQSNNPSEARQNSSSNPPNQGHGALKGLNDWINSIAQKMSPPPSTGTGQPYTGPLAINGHSPLYYLNEEINKLANSLPGGSNGLQQASQATNQFANQNFRDQWTQPMSPQAAVGQVGGAFAGAAIGKGLGAAAGVLKTSFTEAAANGAGNAGALRAAAGSLGAAGSAGMNAAKQEAATLSGFAGANGGGGLGGGGEPGAGESPPYNGEVSDNGGGSSGGPNGSDGGSSFPPENPGSGGGGAAPPGGSEPIVFSEDTPPNIGQTVTKFELGAQGGSIKGITPQTFAGKTWQGVVQDVGNQGGGWRSAGPGKWITNDGKWTASETMPESIDPGNPNKVPMIFLENQDGGVIRIKPMGVPQGSLKSMQTPHYALYEKVNPAGDTSWNNEAFKVNDGAAIPKSPAQVEPLPGMPKYSQLGEKWLQENPGKPFPPGNVAAYYSPEFDQYLNSSGWVNAAHQPLAGGYPSWSPGMFKNVMRATPN